MTNHRGTPLVLCSKCHGAKVRRLYSEDRRHSWTALCVRCWGTGKATGLPTPRQTIPTESTPNPPSADT